MVNGRKIKIVVMGATRRCFLCNSVEHIKTNCPRNVEIGKDSRENGTIKDRVPEARSVTTSSSEEIPMDAVAVQPNTEEGVAETILSHYGQEYPEYTPKRKFVATKRAISLSPGKQSKKTHEEEKGTEEGNVTLDERSGILLL